MSPGRRVTSREVAERAGVSVAAVSLVLNDKDAGRITAERAKVIRAVAAEMGYRPNAAARALAMGSADAVGLAVPLVTQPFFSFVLDGAQAAAHERDSAVMLIDAADNDTGAYERLRAAGAISGLLWFGGLPPRLAAAADAVVLMEADDERHRSVRFAVEDGFGALGEHLRDHGHTRVAHLRAGRPGETDDPRGRGVARMTFHRRAAGLRDGLGFPPPIEVPTLFDVEAARATAHRLLDAADPPTAIVGDDDHMAVGALLAAQDRGLRVPEDVSIAGMDDLEIGRITRPQLTTVRLDGRHLGATAFQALHAVMRDEPGPQRQVLPVEFLPRGSTGPVGS